MAGKFPLDLSKFKKVRSDTHTTTLKHPEGHEIRIAHAAVSPKMRSQLAALPTMMAEGGDPVDGGNMADNAAKPQAPVTINIGTPSATPQDGNALDANAKAMDQQPTAPPPEPIMAGAPPQSPGMIPSVPSSAQGTPPPAQSGALNDPFGTQATYDTYEKGLAQQQAGIKGEAAALGQEGKQESAALQQGLDSQYNAQDEYEVNKAKLFGEHDDFIKDYKNQHIDPQHYLNSMGTGQKIASAIGLVLGGFGAIAGQPNAALQFINRQIDLDVEAQKADMDKQHNLLKANMEQFHNLRDATDMTRAMQMSITADKIKMAAANAKDPLAKFRADKESGALSQNAAQIIGQMAARKTLLSGVNKGKIPPEHIVNVLYPPGAEREEANKQLKQAQDAVALRDNTLSSFDQVYDMNTLKNRMLSPWETADKIEGVQGAALDKLTKDTSGRVTPETVNLIGGLFTKMRAKPATRDVLRNELNKILTQSMHYPQLKHVGIDLIDSSSRYDKNGSSKVKEFSPK